MNYLCVYEPDHEYGLGKTIEDAYDAMECMSGGGRPVQDCVFYAIKEIKVKVELKEVLVEE